jgi:hypothetical protein
MRQAIQLSRPDFPSFTERFRAFTCLWIWSAQLDYKLMLWNLAGTPSHGPELYATPWDRLAAIAGTSEVNEWQHPLVQQFRRRIVFDYHCGIYRYNFQHYHFNKQEDGTYTLWEGDAS